MGCTRRLGVGLEWCVGVVEEDVKLKLVRGDERVSGY